MSMREMQFWKVGSRKVYGVSSSRVGHPAIAECVESRLGFS